MDDFWIMYKNHPNMDFFTDFFHPFLDSDYTCKEPFLQVSVVWWAIFRVSIRSMLTIFTVSIRTHMHVWWVRGRCIRTYVHTYITTATFSYEWFMWTCFGSPNYVMPTSGTSFTLDIWFVYASYQVVHAWKRAIKSTQGHTALKRHVFIIVSCA